VWISQTQETTFTCDVDKVLRPEPTGRHDAEAFFTVETYSISPPPPKKKKKIITSLLFNIETFLVEF